MSPNLEKCRADALKLTPNERAELAESLIASLDEPDEADAEQAWLEEADKRYQAYKQGRISSRPAEDVLRDARSAIQ